MTPPPTPSRPAVQDAAAARALAGRALAAPAPAAVPALAASATLHHRDDAGLGQGRRRAAVAASEPRHTCGPGLPRFRIA